MYMENAVSRPTGHTQVRRDKRGGGRSYWAFWYDQDGKRGGRRLGPAHVRDSGRRTPRGAIVWRAGNGSKPTPEHLTPKDAEERLRAILERQQASAEAVERDANEHALWEMLEGWMHERDEDCGLKRSTRRGYESLFTRFYRDLGEETPISEFSASMLRDYFTDYEAFHLAGAPRAAREKAEGADVRLMEIRRWTAQPPGSVTLEVSTKEEAVRLADRVRGTWKHRRPGTYCVVPASAKRPRVVSRSTADRLRGEGWTIKRRVSKMWMVVRPATTATRNGYRDVMAAAFNFAIREGWLEHNPLSSVKRKSRRGDHARILSREDFYSVAEMGELLAEAPTVVEELFWLLGCHAGLRLPGEALGLTWGMVDLGALVLRPQGNWILEAVDTPKTAMSQPIPMTPRMESCMLKVKARGWATSDEDFVFAREQDYSRPLSERDLREAFKVAQKDAGLRPIHMYNLRHSFGTALAREGVDIRTIQGLMRHTRLTTTEQYMAYAPQPELAERMTRALDPDSVSEKVTPIPTGSAASLLERLEEEIPAKWLSVVEGVLRESEVAGAT